MPKSQKKDVKAIRAAIKGSDDTRVKVSFFNGVPSPAEFTSMLMALLDAYSNGLLETNSREAVFDHWNAVFGAFLHRILPEEEIERRDERHREFVESVDEALGGEFDAADADRVKAAAYVLAGQILTDAGMDPDSVNVLLNRKMGRLSAPKGNGEAGEA